MIERLDETFPPDGKEQMRGNPDVFSQASRTGVSKYGMYESQGNGSGSQLYLTQSFSSLEWPVLIREWKTSS